MILAYPHVPSTTAGGQLELHVWRSPGQFSIRVFRVVALEPPPTRQNRLLQQPYGLEQRSEEHTSELQSQSNLVCRLLLEKTNTRAARQRAHTTLSRAPGTRSH